MVRGASGPGTNASGGEWSADKRSRAGERFGERAVRVLTVQGRTVRQRTVLEATSTGTNDLGGNRYGKERFGGNRYGNERFWGQPVREGTILGATGTGTNGLEGRTVRIPGLITRHSPGGEKKKRKKSRGEFEMISMQELSWTSRTKDDLSHLCSHFDQHRELDDLCHLVLAQVIQQGSVGHQFRDDPYGLVF